MTNTDELHIETGQHGRRQSHTSPVGQKGSTSKNKTVPGNETETETLERKCDLSGHRQETCQSFIRLMPRSQG